MVEEGKTAVQFEEHTTEDLLASMGNRLHLMMLKLTIIYGFGFTIINYLIGTPLESLLSFSLVPVCGFTWWLFHTGRETLSKVLSFSLILLIVSLVSALVSPDVVTPIFLIPIIAGMLIIFPGKEQKIGYAMAIIAFLILIFLLVSDFNLRVIPYQSPEKMHTDRNANILGVTFFCILEVFFVMRVGKIIQKLLIDRGERLKQSNQRLTSLVHSRESMMSILSHDLRAPLTLIVSTLDLMRPGRFPPDQLEGLVEKVSNRTRNTLLMLDSLLLWSRSHLEGAGFEKEKISLKAIRKNLLDYCELLSTEKEVDYEILIPEEAEILANHAMLETILRNLISNAFKFTPAGGRILVKAERQEQDFAFFVEDNGRGMSPESLKHLRNGIAFSMEGTDREKGHGLGIQIVRDFLQKLDSTIEVHSEPGKGTQFVFTLPQE
jgi:signal transduction histidine kinase